MKKFLSMLAVIAVLSFTVVGCTDEKKDKEKEKDSKKEKEKDKDKKEKEKEKDAK